MANTPPPIPNWKCELVRGMERGTVLNTPLTVGDIVGLSCKGEMAQLLDSTKVSILEAGKEKSYALKVIKVHSLTEQSAELDVTSYETGEHKEVSVLLTDGTNFIKAEPLGWNVKSVIPEGQPPEPFGPFGPWRMKWPLWWWIVLAVIVLVVAFFTWRKARQVAKRRRLQLEVEEYCKRHSPFDELQRELRQMQRKIERGSFKPAEMLPNLHQGFRLFVMRTLVVPALELSERRLRREIWQRHKATFKKDLHQELYKFLTELKRANRADVSEKDTAQLVEWAQNLSEKLDAALSRSAA